jgi:hypothetical protein
MGLSPHFPKSDQISIKVHGLGDVSYSKKPPIPDFLRKPFRLRLGELSLHLLGFHFVLPQLQLRLASTLRLFLWAASGIVNGC